MKLISPPKALFLFLTCLLLSWSVLQGATYHVSPSGNDSASGTSGDPFKTISQAAAIALAGDVVIIHQGLYTETVRPANSGSAGNPIVFRSAPGDRVVISAMTPINGWTSDGGGRYKANIGWDLGQLNFVMNGETVMDLARWPNNTDGDPYSLNSMRNDGGSGENTANNAYLLDSDIPSLDWTGGSILFYGDRPGAGWTTWKSFITSSSSGRVNFDVIKNQPWILSNHPPSDGGDYYLEGIKAALDYQNEWYFDESNNTLFVQLPGNAAPQPGQIMMRQRDLTVDLNGRNYVHFENLAVFGGGIEINGEGNELYGLSSFYGSMTRGISDGFNAGANAIFIKWSATNTRVEYCEIAFGAGSGIWDAGDNTVIDNCHIHDFNTIGTYDGDIMARDGNNTTITNSTLYRSGRDVLQIINKGSVVAHNDFTASNLISDDCALLYSIGPGLNLEIHHNWLHDTEGRGSLKKAAGIYLDNDAGDVSVHHNVVYNTEWSSIQINWDGANIDVFNNTLWDGEVAMGAWHLTGTMFTNVKVWNNLTNKNSLEPQSDQQNNLVMSTSASPFVNEAALNFQLKPGEQGIDYGRVIAGITDGYQGTAPDAGAYETGATPWQAGIQWDPASGPAGRCYGLPGEGCAPDGPLQALPVTLSHFSANKQGNKQSLLRWQVDREIDFSHYEIERSTEASPFETIGSVAGTGERTYAFIDHQPIKGDNHYRLRLIDRDGSFAYSDVQLLNFTDEAAFSVFPNPARRSQSVTLSPGTTEPAEARLLDATGRLLATRTITGRENWTLTSLRPGLYFIELLRNGGKEVERLVVE